MQTNQNLSLKNQLLAFLKFSAGKDTLDSTLKLLLTPEEYSQLCKRLEIIKLLLKGIPQREISQKLKVGIATVTRGAREIQRGKAKVAMKFFKTKGQEYWRS